MKLLSVGLKGTTEDIRERLQLDCKTLIQDGFRVVIDETHKGHYTFIGCNVIEGELSFRNYERIKNSMKNHVAKMLAELIVVREEKKIVKKMIEHYYGYYAEEERKVIYEHTIERLNGNHEVMLDFTMPMRCTAIFEKIIEYLDTHHELVLEGFIHFRLKEYRERLMQVVDKAADDYVMEMEYKEFIQVLQGFVDIQESQIEEVHVLVIQDGVYRIVDNQGQSIDNQSFESFLIQRSEQINYEDLLITALITMAPYHIVMHLHRSNNSVTQSVVTTIKNIFSGRVMICEGCDFCY